MRETSEKKQIATMWLLTILILILIAMLVGLFVMFVKSKQQAKIDAEMQLEQLRQELTAKMEEETKVKKVDETKEWIYDADYKKYTYSDSYKTVYGKTYYAKDIIVPYINIYSADASKVNSEIKTIMEKVVEFYNEGVKDNISYVDECNYKKYVNGDILSVVLTYGFGATDEVHPKYKTYNFNLKTGQLLTYEETYEVSGYNANNIEDNVENAITRVMRDKSEGLEKHGYPDGTNFDTYNNESITNYKNSVKNNSLEYYLDSNNGLNVVVTLSIPVGTGKFDTIIAVKETDSIESSKTENKINNEQNIPSKTTSNTENLNTPSGNTTSKSDSVAEKEYLNVIDKLEIENPENDVIYDLIYFNDDDVPDLVAGKTGNWISLYVYKDGMLYNIIDKWTYGISGNSGYKYQKRTGIILNYQTEYAGAVINKTTYILNESNKFDTLKSKAHGATVQDQETQDTVDKYLEENGGYFFNDKKITETEYNSKIKELSITTDESSYEWLAGSKTAAQIREQLEK